MNKINAFLYWLAMLPKGIYRQLGVDTNQVAIILRYKLIMDDRRPNTFQQTQTRKRKDGISTATYGTMFIALLMGLLNLVSFAVGQDEITHFTVYFTLFLFLLSATLITDFTSVLIDVRDNALLLPKPVNDRSFLLARLLHIGVHMSRVILPMLLPALVYLGISYGIAVTLAFLLVALLASLFTIFLINAVYLLIIRVTTPERFKSFIAWFQIGFMILMYGAYQFFPRVADTDMLREFSVTVYRYMALLPPYWFAAGIVGVTGLDDSIGFWWILVALICSIGSCWLVIRFLAPAFNRKLGMIAGSGGAEVDNRGAPATVSRSVGYADWLARWLTGSFAERAGFLFTWKWALRNRGFRMRVYPAIGYILVWFGMSWYRNVFQSEHISSGALRGSSAGILGLIYLSCFILISAIQQISKADEYKAAWIFYSTPLEFPGQVISGMFKALLAQFFLPLAVVLVLVSLAWQGVASLPNLALGFSNQALIAGLLLLINNKKLPASVPASTSERSGSFLKGLAMLAMSGGIGLAHYFIYNFTVVVIMSAVLSMIACWLVFGRIGRISWKEVSDKY